MVTPSERIDAYLRSVRAGLRELPQPEIMDILNELRAHIEEKAGPDAAVVDIDSVLRSLGSPEQIAALYVAEDLVSRAESSRAPWTILRSLYYWATLSVKGFAVFSICLIGYAFSACFLISALMKPIHPQGVGLWTSNVPGAYSLHVGGSSGPAGQEREVLGWWLVPIGCSLGGGTILLTTHFALLSLRRLRGSWREKLP